MPTLTPTANIGAALPDAPASRASSASWLTFTLVFLLMMMDYVDRQIIVAMFPLLKAEFGWTDTQLGGLVSVVAITVGLGALPIAMWVDRWSRTRGILLMGSIWSLATVVCGMAGNYLQLFVCRLFVGVGEAGYGPAGSALLASRFPARMHGFILAAFQAAGGIGSIVGVVLGGYIAAHWGWRAAFGVVGIPGLVLALLFWFVPDYRTHRVASDTPKGGATLATVLLATVRAFRSAPTALLVSLGGAMQLALVTVLITWLPSFFARIHGMATERAGATTAMVILAFSIGAVLWGRLIDRVSAGKPRRRIHTMGLLCVVNAGVAAVAFGLLPVGPAQIGGIVLCGLFMGCTMGTVLAIVLEVIHPAFRATAAAFTTLVGNLGMAVGPFALGMLSDARGLPSALAVTPVFSLLAAVLFVLAAPFYLKDARQAADFRQT